MHGESGSTRDRPGFRVRTITAGVDLARLDDLRTIERALDALDRIRTAVTAEGYEVQTIRIATPPLLPHIPPGARAATLAHLRALDEVVAARGALVSLGPAATLESDDRALASWVTEIIQATKVSFVSLGVASEASGVHRRSARVAADVICALGRTTAGGSGNFRFAAAASIPPGTPFFPVAYQRGADCLAVGLETAGLVHDALASPERGDDPADIRDDPRERLREALARALVPVDGLVRALAERERRAWLGIDTSPAPLQDVSIGRAIEAWTRRPFGASGTLDACALVTSVLRDVPVAVCGYCGLMLPVLEDRVLAQRASEGRFHLRDLLLFSSVCGTGLDLVPLPGDVAADVLSGIIVDVAALSARLRKPLSTRLYLVPGKSAGEWAHFDDPYLTDAVVMSPER